MRYAIIEQRGDGGGTDIMPFGSCFIRLTFRDQVDAPLRPFRPATVDGTEVL